MVGTDPQRQSRFPLRILNPAEGWASNGRRTRSLTRQNSRLHPGSSMQEIADESFGNCDRNHTLFVGCMGNPGSVRLK
jgi:hypothetical protein